MPLNDSTAQPCAHTDRDELARKFMQVYDTSDASTQLIIQVFVHAVAEQETAHLRELIKLYRRNKNVREAAQRLIALIEAKAVEVQA